MQKPRAQGLRGFCIDSLFTYCIVRPAHDASTLLQRREIGENLP